MIEEINDQFQNSDQFKESFWDDLARIEIILTLFISTTLLTAAFIKKKKNPQFTFLPPFQEIMPQVTETFSTEQTIELLTHAYQSRPPEKIQKVHQLFTTLADENLLSLCWKRAELNQLGNEIRDLHPLDFLAVMPKNKIRKILQENSSFKVNPFTTDIGKAILREQRTNNLDHYISAFAIEMKKNEMQIKQLIQTHDWKRLACYLYDVPV